MVRKHSLGSGSSLALLCKMQLGKGRSDKAACNLLLAIYQGPNTHLRIEESPCRPLLSLSDAAAVVIVEDSRIAALLLQEHKSR